MKGMVIVNLFAHCAKAGVFVSSSLPAAKRRTEIKLEKLTGAQRCRLEAWQDDGRIEGGHELSVGVETWTGSGWERCGEFYATATVIL